MNPPYLLGLLGYPLSHSFSPAYFKKKFAAINLDIDYQLFEIEEVVQFEKLFQLKGLLGFNVTVPHKQAIIPFLDELSPDAQAMGAVNTVVLSEGKRWGFNTDWQGFSASVFPDISGISKALVLGTGGSSKAITYALQKMGLEVFTVSRTAQNADFLYQNIPATLLEHELLIVNCTPVGMSPHVNESPDFPYHWVHQKHFVYDLIYNPQKTLFLKKCEAQGARVKNGQDMLLLQAEKSWELWSNFHPQILIK
jgi:shikimate dehydrogenase